MSTIGIYCMVATLLWGRLALRDRAHARASAALRARRSRRPCSRSARSASCSPSRFVRYRTAWALGNLFEYPVWLICGFLVPLALLPDWVRPISWVLAPTWGMSAIRESALGGTPLPDIAACASRSARVYVAIGVLVLERVLRAARAQAALSLT